MTNPKVFVTTFQLQKFGNAPEEYEDAFYPKEEGVKQENIFHFAIADGASEGMLSGKWAEILVKIFCLDQSFSIDPVTFLDRAYGEWNSWEKDFLLERARQNRAIRWYEEQGLQTGAFSTFLGLSLTCYKEKLYGKWEAAALGDSCLFQARDDQLIAGFPLEHSSDFNNRPLLISSNPALNEGIFNAFRLARGEWRIDDRFYLMTDALADWFLKEFESGQAPWLTLSDLGTEERGHTSFGEMSPTSEQKQSFDRWIADLRNTKKIRNDDVTLIRIDLI